MIKARELSNETNNAASKVVMAGKEALSAAILDSLPSEYRKMHETRLIHIHDLEFYNTTYNCIGIDAASLAGTGNASFAQAVRRLGRGIVALTNEQSGGIGIINADSDLAQFIGDESDEALDDALRGLFIDLNCYTRKGCEKPYVTFNFGLGVSDKERRVAESFLRVCREGDDDGCAFIFPNLVFKLKKGVNTAQGDPNYDLFETAVRTTAQRMLPTYLNCDSSANGTADINPARIGIMGCRSRVVKNLFGESSSLNRGNVAAVSINLVQAALRANGSLDRFYAELDGLTETAAQMLLCRFHTLTDSVNLSRVFNAGYYMGSDSGNAFEMLKNGTLAIGFIGLWDALGVIFGKDWTDADSMKPYLSHAYEVVRFMRGKTDAFIAREHLNFSLLASSAEGISGAFARYDEAHDGKGCKVCEKGYYSNSFHVPVTVEIDFFTKLEMEGPFHKLCNGGSISYVELKEMPSGNPEAVAEIIESACDADCNYIGINFRLDQCRDCGYTGKLRDKCPRCGSHNIRRLRRVSGYLAEVEDFSAGKKKELADRRNHL